MKQQIVALTLLLSAAAWAGPLADSAGWIGGLRGVSRTTVQETATGYQATYAAADGNAAMDSIRAGLMKRGWMVDTGGEVSVGGAVSTQTVRARKDNLRMEVALANVASLAVLNVRVSAGALPGQQVSLPPNATSVPANATTTSGGGSTQTVINDSHVSQDITAQGGMVVINGSHCTLRILGSCSRVILNGSNNTVSVAAKVQGIQIAGSYNQVNWSSVANPQAPEISDVGASNRVQQQ